MPKTHLLKIDERFYERIVKGEKTCEIRKNDRDFQSGDLISFNVVPEIGLSFKEKNNFNSGPLYKITHVLIFPQGLQIGYVALSIKLLNENEN